MDNKDKPLPDNYGFYGCPFCGEVPVITKHFREDMWNLIHRCKIIGVISLDWSDSIKRLKNQWNHRTRVD